MYFVQINHLDVTVSLVYEPDVYFTAQHVSGVLTPIMRSSTAAIAAAELLKMGVRAPETC
jgi:hypothetical protein